MLPACTATLEMPLWKAATLTTSDSESGAPAASLAGFGLMYAGLPRKGASESQMPPHMGGRGDRLMGWQRWSSLGTDKAPPAYSTQTQ
jgi:hypothetical protein